jgi:transposase
MESMGRKKPRPRRSFTPEFKAEVVELCQRGDRSVGQVARDFDLTETAVREWVKQAERDAGTRVDGGLTSAERAELVQLRRECRRLREDVEILKRRRLSSPRRPGDGISVHRGGEGWQAQRRPGVRAAEGLPRRLLPDLAGPSRRDRADAELTEQIQAVHAESKGRYGAPRVHAELRRRGRRHGRKRIARLMRTARIAGPAPRRWKKTTIADPAAARADQRRRGREAVAGQRWQH